MLIKRWYLDHEHHIKENHVCVVTEDPEDECDCYDIDGYLTQSLELYLMPLHVFLLELFENFLSNKLGHTLYDLFSKNKATDKLLDLTWHKLMDSIQDYARSKTIHHTSIPMEYDEFRAINTPITWHTN